jgi:hypothetical protein
MQLGNGSLGFTKRNSTSGAPFSAASAKNGVSINADGQVVLGDDGAPHPSQLDSIREIITNGNQITLAEDEDYTTSTELASGVVTVNKSAGDTKKTFVKPGSVEIQDKEDGVPRTRFIYNVAQDVVDVIVENGSLRVQNTAGNILFQITADGEIQTGDPGAGVGSWKLGTVIADTVALDTANYVEATIDGVTVKLAIVI